MALQWAQSSSPDVAAVCLSRLLLSELFRVYSLGLCWAGLGFSWCWVRVLEPADHTHTLIFPSQVSVVPLNRASRGSE